MYIYLFSFLGDLLTSVFPFFYILLNFYYHVFTFQEYLVLLKKYTYIYFFTIWKVLKMIIFWSLLSTWPISFKWLLPNIFQWSLSSIYLVILDHICSWLRVGGHLNQWDNLKVCVGLVNFELYYRTFGLVILSWTLNVNIFRSFLSWFEQVPLGKCLKRVDSGSLWFWSQAGKER